MSHAIRRAAAVAAVAALAAAAAAGCSSKVPRLTVLEGQVTLDGKPLKAGYLQFLSDDNVTSTGVELSADGRYRLPGAPVGPTHVAVVTRQYKILEPNENDPESKGGKKPNPRYMAVPEKYATPETSGLAFNIASGQRELNIELSSK